jgi:hypothetical protein
MFFDGLYNFCASKDNYETDWVLLAWRIVCTVFAHINISPTNLNYKV